MTKEQLLIIIDHYINGNASEEDIRLLDQYYKSFQEKENWPAWEDLAESRTEIEHSIWERLEIDMKGVGNLVPRKRFWNSTWGYLSAACVLVVLLMISYFMFGHKPKTDEEFLVVETKAGECKHVTLTDGTQIWLQPESRLVYPLNFEENKRVVKFIGNALFEVKHDEKSPFYIYSHQMQTRVLGTTFNMSVDDSSNEVTLINGRLEVSLAEKKLLLSPNHKATVDVSTGMITQNVDANAQDLLLRKEGKYIYNGTKLTTVVRDLEKYFNCSITLKEQLQGCTFYGSFDINETLSKIISLIAISLNGTYNKINDQQYLISGVGCN